jgi:hypothetical protein
MLSSLNAPWFPRRAEIPPAQCVDWMRFPIAGWRKSGREPKPMPDSRLISTFDELDQYIYVLGSIGNGGGGLYSVLASFDALKGVEKRIAHAASR